MANPRRTYSQPTKKKQKKRNEHVAAPEVQKQARESAKKTVKKAAQTVTKATQTTARPSQTVSRPRNYSYRPNTPSAATQRSNQPKTTTPKINRPQVGKTPSTKTSITDFTKAKSDYQNFKNSLTYKTISERNKEKESKKKKIDYTAAYNKGKNRTYLGTEEEKRTIDIGESAKVGKKFALDVAKEGELIKYYSSDEYKAKKKLAKAASKKQVSDYLVNELGYSKSEAKDILATEIGKEAVNDQYKHLLKEDKKAVKKELNKYFNKKKKAIDKEPGKLESVTALSKNKFDRMVESERFTDPKMKELIKKGTGVGGEDINRLVDAKTAESMLKGKFMSGVIQGMSPVDVYRDVGKYDPAAKKAKEIAQNSGKYMAGYGVGLAAQMAMGRTGVLGKSLAGAALKGSAKSGAKRFAANRLGELAAETPVNILDAAKMATDENGKINAKDFAKWMGFNTALTGGMGGALEGAGAVITKSQSNKMIKLLAERQTEGLSLARRNEIDDEIAGYLSKLQKKAKPGDTLSSSVADNAIEQRRQIVTKAANEAADKSRKASQAQFDAIKNRQHAIVEANNTHEKALTHLENNIKRATETRDVLSKSVDDLRVLRKKNGTLAGHQEIVSKYGSVERLDAVINQTEKALSESRKRLRDTRTNLSTENKRYNRKLAKIDTDYPPVKQSTQQSNTNIPKPTDDIANGSTGWSKTERDEYRQLQARYKELNEKNKKLGLTKYESQEAKEIRQKLDNITNGEAPANKQPVKSADEVIDEKLKTETDAKFKELNDSLKDARKLENDAWDDFNAKNDAFKNRDKAATSGSDFHAMQQEVKAAKEEAERLTAERKRIETKVDAEKDKIRNGAYNALPDDEYNLKSDSEVSQPKGETETVKPESGNNAVISREGATPDEIRKLQAEGKLAKEGDGGSKKVESVVEKARKLVDNSKEGKKNTWQRVRMAVVDNLAALEDYARTLPPKQKAAFLSQINGLRMAQKAGKANFVANGREIYKKYGLKPKSDKLKDYEFYCRLKHDLDVYRQDPEKEFLGLTSKANTVEENIELLENTIRKFEEDSRYINKKTGEVEIASFQKEITEYYDKLLDMEVDAGVASKEFAKELRAKYPNYVPSYRETDFDKVIDQSFRDEINVGKGMKAMKGGANGMDFVPLYNTMIAKTNSVYKRTELNRTMNLLADAMGVNKDALETVGKNANVDDEVLAESALETIAFTPKPEGGQYKVWYFRDGEKFEMPVSKNVFDGIRDWSGEDKLMLLQNTIFAKTLDKIGDNMAIRGAARFFKEFITDYNIYFGIKNFKRDISTALFYTKDLKGYVKAFPKALVCSNGLIPTKLLSDEYKMYRKVFNAYRENGGIYSQLVNTDRPMSIGLRDISKANPLRVIESINSWMETVPRTAEFFSAIDSAAMKKAGVKSWGDSVGEGAGNVLTQAQKSDIFDQVIKDHDAVTQAMYRAKDVTLNFDRSGWLTKKLNRGWIPFLNPSIQGLDKLVRTLGSDNVVHGVNGAINKQQTALKMLGFSAKFTGMVAAPVAAWEAWFGDYYAGKVDGYEPISDYNRYAYYCLPTGDGKYIKIPRARELASMQSFYDYAFQKVKYGNGQEEGDKLFVDTSLADFKSWGRISWEQIGPVNPVSDNMLAAGWRTYKGKNWYGGFIETYADQEKVEQGKSNEVWDENTSWLARQLGNTETMKKWKISPKKIDNAMDSYLGIIYDFAISQQSAKNQVVGDAVKGRSNDSALLTMLQSQVSTNFMIDSVFSNRYASDNYNQAKVLKDKLETLEEGTKEYNETKGKLTRLNNSFAYNATQFDELSSQIYLSDKLTGKQKNNYVRQLKQSKNSMWAARYDDKVTSPVDPLKVIYDMKDGKGNNLLSTRDMLKACSYTNKDGENYILDAYDTYKKGGGKSGKFMKATIAWRDVNRYAGDSLSSTNWRVTAFACGLNGMNNVDDVLIAYGDKDDKGNLKPFNKRDSKLYQDYGGSLSSYKKSRKTVVQAGYDLGYDYPSQMEQWDKANALSDKQHTDLAYFAEGTYSKTYKGYDTYEIMNASRCLKSDKYKKSNWSTEKINAFCKENKFTYKGDKKPDPKKVEKAIRKKYGNGKYTNEELAALYYEIVPYGDNPFGEIGDYSRDDDSGISPYSGSGYGGYGHRGRGRRGGGRRSSGGGSGTTPAATTTRRSYKVTKQNAKISVHDYTKKSNLNEAYRKRYKKLRKELDKS